MPRRVYEYPDIADLHVLNLISTIGSFILALGVAVTAYNLLRSLKKGGVAGPDPHDGGVLGAKVTTDDLYFQPGHGCDWGSAPDFLAGGPGAGAPSVALTPPGRLETTAALAPPNGPWSEYGWLRVRLAPGHGAGTVTISDGPASSHRITFRVLRRATGVIQLPIGACSQWYGYGSHPLLAETSAPGLVQAWALSR